MRKFFKILAYVTGSFVVLLLMGMIYFNTTFPKVDRAPDIKVDITQARIARGKYLANHVAGCIACHSERDWTKYAAPVMPGTLGKGGEVFNKQTDGVPGALYAYNITPANLGNWTDGEIIRAITCGVNKSGEALFPLMPFMPFNKLSKEDLYSIVAYLRTLKPIKNYVPKRTLDFPLNFIVKTMPLRSYTPQSEPDTSNMLGYGKYLVEIASCISCHTQMIKGQPVKGMEFAGGFEFHMSGGIVRSANITPDSATGIGSWSEAMFINYIKSFASDSMKNIAMKPNQFNTPMPLTQFAGMTDHDLAAIYTYLRTVKPIHNSVVWFTRDN